MATAARETAASGRIRRRLAKRPRAAPSRVVTAPATMSVPSSTPKVWPRSERENTSK